MWLFLCVHVSPLLCLIKSLPLGLGPPTSRRISFPNPLLYICEDPVFEIGLVLRSSCPRVDPPEPPGQGPSHLFQLLGAPGIHPWAGDRLPPVSPSISTCLLLHVHISLPFCLVRTLSLGLGPPLFRKTSSQTLHPITSAETLFPNNMPL